MVVHGYIRKIAFAAIFAGCGRLNFEHALTIDLRCDQVSAFDNAQLFGRLAETGHRADLDRYVTTVTQDSVTIVRLVHAPSAPLEIDVYVDVDGDGKCGPADRSWQFAVDGDAGRIEVVATPANTSVMGCEGHPLRADLDGDGCVSQADIDLVTAASGSADLGADVNSDGAVNATDIFEEKQSRGLGCSEI